MGENAAVPCGLGKGCQVWMEKLQLHDWMLIQLHYGIGLINNKKRGSTGSIQKLVLLQKT